MKNKISYIVVIVVVTFFNSCSSRAREEKEADAQLAQIQQLIAESKYDAALSKIDTLHKLFPRLVSKRKIAVAYKDTIVRRESSKVLAFSDSILPIKVQKLDSIVKNFKYEKDEKYQEYGNYVYKSQITEQNTSRNYLKCFVDDNVDIYLISNVFGTRLNHIGLKVSVNELFVQTDTTQKSNGNFHSFTEEGNYWESLTFKNETDGGVTSFITQHKSERVKVNLLCNRNITYYLSDQDKKAIASTYELWILKRDLKKLQNDIRISTIKIGQIKLRYKQ